MKLNGKIFKYFAEREKNNKFIFVLKGGRRSGKTFATCQKLLILCNNTAGTLVNIASMTAEQGRLGAYADFNTIIKNEEYFTKICTLYSSPREIRFRNGSKIFFNSYQNSETAKGVACDYLYINEANNFTKQQYTDLVANVRKGVFLDYNPNHKFWIEDYVKEDEILTTTWKDNYKNLTPLQLEYFFNLKKLAEKDGATDLDIRNYKIYYCGEYYELRGEIFNRYNLKITQEEPVYKKNIIIFADPSALRGGDYFALCLGCQGDDGKIYILRTHSTNVGSKEEIIEIINKWRLTYDVKFIYIETNGIIGQTFYEDCQKEKIPITPYCSRLNKFERIIANYGKITNEVVFVDRPGLQGYLSQIYDFGEKCEHDDNIDAVNSLVTCYNYF